MTSEPRAAGPLDAGLVLGLPRRPLLGLAARAAFRACALLEPWRNPRPEHVYGGAVLARECAGGREATPVARARLMRRIVAAVAAAREEAAASVALASGHAVAACAQPLADARETVALAACRAALQAAVQACGPDAAFPRAAAAAAHRDVEAVRRATGAAEWNDDTPAPTELLHGEVGLFGPLWPDGEPSAEWSERPPRSDEGGLEPEWLERPCAQALPERERTVLALRNVERLSWSEIAAAECYSGPVAARTAHARAAVLLAGAVRARDERHGARCLWIDVEPDASDFDAAGAARAAVARADALYRTGGGGLALAGVELYGGDPESSARLRVALARPWGHDPARLEAVRAALCDGAEAGEPEELPPTRLDLEGSLQAVSAARDALGESASDGEPAPGATAWRLRAWCR